MGTGCGLDAVGTAPAPGAADASTTGGPDASAQADGDATNAAPDACGGASPNTTGVIRAPRARGPVAIDGDLDDWACVPFVRLDADTAAEVTPSTPRARSAYEFAVVWDEAGIYVAVRAIDDFIGGQRTADVYQNDSVEVYVDADGVLTGAYGPNDHQYVVDHQNVSEDYGPEPPLRPPQAGFSSAIAKVTGGYVVEMRIAPSELGTTFQAGAQLGFDFVGNNSDGLDRTHALLWYRAPTCSCTTGCCCGAEEDRPFCNTQRFGRLELAP